MAKLLSWNVNGLNSPQKRRIFFHYLKQYKNDIICLQETHIISKDKKYLFNPRLGINFAASAHKKKAGVALYVKKELLPKLIEEDMEGRFIFVEILLNGKKCLVVGLYAPNQMQQQKQFYSLLHQKLTQLDYNSVIMMGDWNGIIDLLIDKQTASKDVSQSKLPTSFFAMQEDLELRDIWRDRYLKERDYTFFSDRHQSHSRIDFFLISYDLFSRVKKVKILPRTLSDHSPVWMQFFMEEGRRKSWRMNENLFRHERNVQKLKAYLKDYFLLNMNKGTSMPIVWDASKAFIRGVLISMNTGYKRKQIQKRKELEEEIKLKETALILDPADKTLKTSIAVLKEQFNMLMADQTETIKRKHNTFCNANKPGRWLAYQIRKKQRMKVIEKILYKDRQVYQQDLIKKSFLDYYTRLYASENIHPSEIDQYLQQANFPTLTEEQQELMNSPITFEEITEAIKQLKVGKAPGTDGLTAIYYKLLLEEMIEPLRHLFNGILSGAGVPPSWRGAFISLIPKEEQDLIEPKNYRPISLLNTDYKIFAKVLANRLMQVLKQTIHSDQSGFITGRYMKDNLRQIVNLVEYLDKNNQIPSALIFLDAEKAFDKLDWQFLFKLVEKMNFGDRFLHALKAIYQQQTAQIVVNGGLTDTLKIEEQDKDALYHLYYSFYLWRFC